MQLISEYIYSRPSNIRTSIVRNTNSKINLGHTEFREYDLLMIFFKSCLYYICFGCAKETSPYIYLLLKKMIILWD